jgi:Glycosyl hydrolases family 25
MIYGCDLSTEYQHGFDIEAVEAAGLRFVAVKLSDGQKGYDLYDPGLDILDQVRYGGRRMVGLGYHYVRPEVPAAEQAAMFALQLRRGSCSGMLDVESGGPEALDLTREIHYQVSCELGYRIAFTYLPRWWWSSIGNPSLAGLPPLWGSRYVSKSGVEVAGTPQQIAAGIDVAAWQYYGGKSVSVLQYTRKATVGQMTVTADAYGGTLADLEQLVEGMVK